MSIETLFFFRFAPLISHVVICVLRVSLDGKGKRDTARSLIETYTYLLLNSRETDHASEDEIRLLQPIFDPDPNLTSIRVLPEDTTANNTSQAKQCSFSPATALPGHQEMQHGTDQDLFRYKT